MDRDIKRLRQKETEIESDLNNLGREIKALTDKKASLREELKKTRNQIGDILQDVIVSEHAVIRYFERILGYDINDIEEKILPKSEKENIKMLTNCEYPIGDMVIIVKNNRVVTVYPQKDGEQIDKKNSGQES